MKKVLLVVLLLGMLMTTAFGQSGILQVKIPFDFVAGGKMLPAGNYKFSVSDNFVTLSDRETGRTVGRFMVITRLAAEDRTNSMARVSFDVKEGKHFIEAVWPLQTDGYLVHTVQGQHSHEVVGSN